MERPTTSRIPKKNCSRPRLVRVEGGVGFGAFLRGGAEDGEADRGAPLKETDSLSLRKMERSFSDNKRAPLFETQRTTRNARLSGKSLHLLPAARWRPVR